MDECSSEPAGADERTDGEAGNLFLSQNQLRSTAETEFQIAAVESGLEC